MVRDQQLPLYERQQHLESNEYGERIWQKMVTITEMGREGMQASELLENVAPPSSRGGGGGVVGNIHHPDFQVIDWEIICSTKKRSHLSNISLQADAIAPLQLAVDLHHILIDIDVSIADLNVI
jgi:hypothetical protein